MKEEESEEPVYNHFEELVLKEVDKGIEGVNIGIPFPMKRLGKKINGIQKQMLILVGGAGGTGKTALVDFLYVLVPYLWIKAQKNKDKGSTINLKVTYHSMERSKKYKLQKWTCVYLYLKHKLVIDVPTINGWSSKLFDVTPEIREKIESAQDFINGMIDSGIVNIIDGAMHPTAILSGVTKYADAHGKTEYDKIIVNGKPMNVNPRYTPNDPDLYHVIILDHMKKLKRESGNSEKDNIDLMSGYCGFMRDRYGYIPIMISQFNRGLSDSSRMKNKVLAPEPSDFASSSNMYDDADLVIGLFNPFKLKIISDLGFDVGKFVTDSGYNRYRSLHVLKNTFGVDDVAAGVLFRGEMGLWEELPKWDDKADLKIVYEKLKRE